MKRTISAVSAAAIGALVVGVALGGSVQTASATCTASAGTVVKSYALYKTGSFNDPVTYIGWAKEYEGRACSNGSAYTAGWASAALNSGATITLRYAVVNGSQTIASSSTGTGTRTTGKVAVVVGGTRLKSSITVKNSSGTLIPMAAK